MSDPTLSPVSRIAHRYANVIACVIVMLIALTAILTSLRFPATPIPTDIGAGAFPQTFAAILIVLCVLQIISELMGVRMSQKHHAGTGERSTVEKRNYLTPAIGAITMVLYIALLSWTGYLLTTFCFLVGLIRLMGLRSFILNLIISAAITAALYFLFDYGLQVPLPTGELFN